MGDRMLTPQDVADYFGVPLATVYRWNSEHTGPRRVRVGKHVRYRPEDVQTWLEQQYAAEPGPVR